MVVEGGAAGLLVVVWGVLAVLVVVSNKHKRYECRIFIAGYLAGLEELDLVTTYQK